MPMVTRRRFIALGAALVPLPAAAQARWGEVREIAGDVRLNGIPMTRQSAIRPGQTVSTGRDGRVWFTVADDAFFLRPGTRLRLETDGLREGVVNLLRLITGGLGAAFRPGERRSVVAHGVTIGIRGTGIYLESAPGEVYACTCFGTTELNGTPVSARNHAARRLRDGTLVEAALERHTSEEMVRLEALAGRRDPFTR